MLNNGNKKKFISGIILFLFIFNLTGIGIAYPKKADAAVATVAGQAAELASKIFGHIKDALKWSWEKVEKAAEWANEERKEIKDHVAAVAFKATLHSFLQTLAIDTATWIATGDKGQKPMFITQGWGAYLSAAADRAAGEFIMTAASEWDNKQKYGDEMQDYNECMEGAYESSQGCISICVNGNVSGKLNANEYEECMKNCDSYTKEESDAIKACNAQYKKYLQGASIGTTGRNYSSGIAGSITRFLCEPDLKVKLRISASLADIERPRTPRCTFSRAKRNWDAFVNDPNFLSKFQSYWDPWENDVGIALTMHSSFLENRKWGIDTSKKAREEGEGWKALTDVAGKILTPSTLIQKMGTQPIEEGTSYAKVYTTDIIADAVGVFADTLMGKLLDKWVKKGLVGSGSDNSDYNWIKGNFSGSSSATIESNRIKADKTKAAKEKFSKVFTVDLQSGKSYSILKKLSLCSDNDNPGPTDCVITQDFITAVSQELTVQEAIDKGYINSEAPFGFIANGLEPSYNEGYPYRSMIILRKYRIIPVGWELAAGYIGDILNSTASSKKVYNLKELIYAFDDSSSPFYKLVDPDWVLKAPEFYCAKEGYGQKLISYQISDGIDMNSDGDYDDKNEENPRMTVARDQYCADERSCIKEDSQGKCLFYGYCSEEGRQWDFKGESCESYYNSCQMFGSPAGKEVSYVKKSLDFNGCDADNAGCEWHCVSRDFAGDGWMCVEPGIDLDPNDLCDNFDGCVVSDISDLDQDEDYDETCVIPYKGIECELDDSNARLVMGTNSIVSVSNDLYFNHNVESCNEKSEGCNEYIRTKPNLGTNLAINPSFEGVGNNNFADWVVINGILSSESFKGEVAFEAEIDGASLNKVVDIGYSIANRKFVFSFYAKGCNAGNFQIIGGSETVALEQSEYWRRFSTAYSFPTTLPIFPQTVSLQISGINDGCIIDAVQLEEVIGFENKPSDYKGYGSSNLLYLKKAPDYYECENYTIPHPFITNKIDCESDGNLWRDDIEVCVRGGSIKCANFALECAKTDVGCDLYTPDNGDPGIPAVVGSDDFCPEECNGYGTYKQETTFFEKEQFPEFIIPEKEKKCSARYAGCSEFTNLHKLEQGGEAIEYYTYLRPCQAVNNSCATFYTWVGSEISGFQLKAYLLLDVDNNQEPDHIFNNPVVPVNIFGICNNYNDAISNPECYEFYSEGGIISYHHYKDTKVCSDECSPYRKTKSTWEDCVGSWGTWNINEECVYEALLKESIKCSKSQNNCYEYKGNTSNNVRKVIDDNFEEAVNNWGAGGMLSSESLIRGGHSLQTGSGSVLSYPLKERCVLNAICGQDDGCPCEDGGKTICYVQNGERSCIYKSLLRNENTYLLSFWAKGNGDLTVKFSSALAGDEFASSNITLSPDWLRYSLGPVFINWDMDTDDPVLLAGTQILESLEILGFSDTSYIDNIILKEVRDDLFLIKPDLWNIPLECNQNYNGNLSPQYMLGCKEYKSKIDKEIVYLKSFDHLCGSDIIGCEALINTFNSDNPLREIFNIGDQSEITVPADQASFLVNSKNKNCKAQDKGCMAVGDSNYKYNQHNTYNFDLNDFTRGRSDDTDDLYNYKTNYYINDPDKYNEILCVLSAVGCDEFDSENGYYYFKNPASQRADKEKIVCEYKSVQGQAGSGWYISGTEKGFPNCPVLFSDLGVTYASKSCVGGINNGNLCLIDSQCPDGDCLDFAGNCPNKDDGCTEYIDPLSKISKNIVFNGDFSQCISGGPDGWIDSGVGYYTFAQPLLLKHNTPYTVIANSANNVDNEVILENCVGLISPDDSIIPILGGMQKTFSTAGQHSGRFYTVFITQCDLRVSSDLVDNNGSIRISETGVYYFLDNSVNKSECNGLIDYNNGCVLFNSREIQNNGNLSELFYDADADSNIPQSCSDNIAECDSNLLIKVRPDRICDEWLTCKTIIEYEEAGETKKQCLDIRLCDSLNEQGECDGFPVTKRENQTATYSSLDNIKDKSGFVKIGRDWGIDGIINGYYPFDRMYQMGGKIVVPNGDFELSDNSNYPIGWFYEDGHYNNNYFQVISNPFESQKNGLGLFAPQGRSFLRLGSGFHVSSQMIPVISIIDRDVPYIISAYMNTLDLLDGEGVIQVLEYDASGNRILPGIPANDFLSYNFSNDWEYKTSSFRLNQNTESIKIRIVVNSLNPIGNVYVDDIKIRPGLGTFLNRNTLMDEYTSQTCRAYPKSDSLACEYIDDSGIRNIGRYGYCLKYDHFPGNPKQCLMWWPVDLVLGEGIEEGGAYNGRYPLYYSIGDRIILIDYPPSYDFQYGYTNLFWANQTAHGNLSSTFIVGYLFNSRPVLPKKNYEVINATGRGTPAFIQSQNSDRLVIHISDPQNDESNYSFELFDSDINQVVFTWAGRVDHTLDIIFTDFHYFTDKIVQVVNPTGQNKYWAGRVFEGSNYIALELSGDLEHYNYSDDYAPFGSIVPPDPHYNPVFWDSKESINGIQPLYYELPDLSISSPYQPRAGQLHNTDSIKRLFAQSYGIWEWNGDSYESVEGFDWTPPENICFGNPPQRPIYNSITKTCGWGDCLAGCGNNPTGATCDWCGVPPEITNINLNGMTGGDYKIGNSKTINLRFNTIIDSNQLPLAMYAVDWGDGTDDKPNLILSSGIGASKPNPENQHSFYHLYGYWDMLSNDSGSSSIGCGMANENIDIDDDGIIDLACDNFSSCCATKVKIKVKDNWGWCNSGTTRNDCESWEEYNGYIIVNQFGT
ncbi:MAG: hypothetical protein U9O55_04465 [Patescibacteria group bacterium]|nr:hypothetical protein [Patescibacteria group bacterium]